ncbi:MAG TPA: glycoside hydrolase family 88 protein [Opitutaceae bacterium]|nr:glycoside hydrolase family 88 protein [Opitutaceae bacterium]
MFLLTGGCQNPPKNSPAAVALSWPAATEVREHMKAAFVPELQAVREEPSTAAKPSNGWIPGVFYAGVSAAWLATGDEDYRRALVQWGESVHWQPAPRPRHADDLCCGQAFLDLYLREGGAERIAAIRARVDAFLAAPQPGRKDWWWCDALFMAPPVFVKLSQATGDPRYREALAPLYWDAVKPLWSEPDHLFYRDPNFVSKPQKIFWARGNAWVLAGLARILEGLPVDDPARARYQELFRTLAARAVELQSPDGAWRANLADLQQFPEPESSSTALFAYGLAWGVNHGLLARADYAPAVLKAWEALKRAQLPSGQLGSVQPAGNKPAVSTQASTAPFGCGAFLLLGAELLPAAGPHAG